MGEINNKKDTHTRIRRFAISCWPHQLQRGWRIIFQLIDYGPMFLYGSIDSSRLVSVGEAVSIGVGCP